MVIQTFYAIDAVFVGMGDFALHLEAWDRDHRFSKVSLYRVEIPEPPEMKGTNETVLNPEDGCEFAHMTGRASKNGQKQSNCGVADWYFVRGLGYRPHERTRGMELRVTTTIKEGLFLVRVDGALAGDEVNELGRMCRSLAGARRLDLSGLRWTDDRGVQMIRTLMAEGTELVDVPRFIDLLLRSHAPDVDD